MMEPKPDIGMAKKMGPKCFPGILELHEGKTIDERPIAELIAFVDDRHDCADFRLICLIKAELAFGSLLSPKTRADIRRCILEFKYSMEEPGIDSMCFWSENHQLLFATCEYLAGTMYSDEIFQNNGMTGTMHRERAEEVLLLWMKRRFAFGFSEWHSNTYYEEDAAPLAVLVDHAPNPEVAKKAAILLDLLFLDMALHRFEGRFVAASGRCYEKQKKNSEAADVNDLMRYAFGEIPGSPDDSRLSSLVLLSDQYRVPETIRGIAAQKGTMVIRDSMGLSLKEVAKEIPEPSFADRGMYLWGMEAFTNPESIRMTMEMFTAWNLHKNVFLRDLSLLDRPLLRKSPLLPTLVRLLNPATQGVAIERANTYTYRTDRYLLSCAQRYRPRGFGDQQHLWQATLPRHINVFSTHPGSPMFDDSARNFSPSYWVGNGINPDLAQDGNVLLLDYDLRPRRGMLERQRQLFIHFHLPMERMDEVLFQEKAVFVRVDESYLAILGDQPAEKLGIDEIAYFGKRLRFAVVCGSIEENGSFRKFMEKVSEAALVAQGNNLTFLMDREYQLRSRGPWKIDGVPIDTEYPRFDTPFVEAERKPERMEIHCGTSQLILDWNGPQRLEKKG